METDIMRLYPTEELRVELNELLRKQREVLESRMLGTASDDDLLDYEMRQEIIHELCNVLAHSGTAKRLRRATPINPRI
jgi:hypothetical protein